MAPLILHWTLLPHSHRSPPFLTSSVPQGAILSPLLFNIMLYDLPRPTQGSQNLLYADDIAITCRAKDRPNGGSHSPTGTRPDRSLGREMGLSLLGPEICATSLQKISSTHTVAWSIHQPIEVTTSAFGHRLTKPIFQVDTKSSIISLFLFDLVFRVTVTL